MEGLEAMAVADGAHQEYSTTKQHPRRRGYKPKRSNHDQASRRKQVLERQKTQRRNVLSLARGITEDSDEGEPHAIEVEEGDEHAMETELDVQGKGSKRRQPHDERKNRFKGQLMLSEWLDVLPGDFVDSWVMALCPRGRRTLVVAAKGNTRAFLKSGRCIHRFPSALPGGSRSQKGFKSSENCILDCIFDSERRVFYVLDIMSWRSHPVYDSDVDFRTFWLHSKLDEVPETRHVSSTNPCQFIRMDKYPCTEGSIRDALAAEHDFVLDGMLFYHREGHYHAGETPIVSWLTPGLVGDVLGLRDVTIPSAVAPEPAVRLQLGAPPAAPRFPGVLQGNQPKRPESMKHTSAAGRPASDTTQEREAPPEAPPSFLTVFAAEAAALGDEHQATVADVACEFQAYVAGLGSPPGPGEMDDLLDEHDRTLRVTLLERDLDPP